jgi:uncharacterized protein YciI
MSASTSRSVRYVVFHKPGSKWKYGIAFREQDGVGDHVQHDLKFHEQGRLEMGGPFLLQDVGGMMIATKDILQAELEAFAAADPAVRSELLIYEIRPWLTAMEHK